jgi:nucleotide-binding universal stress UspA family protein
MSAKMLVPVDGSGTAIRSLQEAVTPAMALGARLHLLNVVNKHPRMIEPAPTAVLYELRRTMRRHGEAVLPPAWNMVTDQAVDADTKLVAFASGRVADVALSKSREQACDLIGMGASGGVTG